MRAKDFIPEAKETKTNPAHKDTFSPAISFPDMNGFYEYYRFLNMVAADPHGDHVEPEHEHFDDTPAAFAYTPEEMEMLKNSASRMGKKLHHITKQKSSDPDGTNVVSPVPFNSGRRK